MSNPVYSIQQYLNYLRNGQSKYYIHSPFVFDFYNQILSRKNSAITEQINAIRQKLAADKTVLSLQDYGAGGSDTLAKSIAVNTLAKRTSIPPKYGNVLYNIVSHYQPQTILELGTSFGISSAYLALAKPDATVTTLEGSAAITSVARKYHEFLGLKNVTIKEGNFDHSLEPTLRHLNQIDLAFIDGNHRKEPTIRYFEMILEHTNSNSILVFDDIYWSEEMTEAWNQIKTHPRVRLSIDIYRMGMVFFRSERLVKEEFVLWY